MNVAQAFLTSGQVPERQGNAHLQIVPYQLFPTNDGWLVLAVGNDGQYRRFCEAAGRPDLATDPRFATNALRVEYRTALVPVLEELFRTRSTQQWEDLLLKAEIPHAPVWDYAAIFAHPQVAARGMRVTIRDPEGRPVDLVGPPFHIAGTEVPRPTMPPHLGEHSHQVLRDLLGLDEQRLAELNDRGVI